MEVVHDLVFLSFDIVRLGVEQDVRLERLEVEVLSGRDVVALDEREPFGLEIIPHLILDIFLIVQRVMLVDERDYVRVETFTVQKQPEKVIVLPHPYVDDEKNDLDSFFFENSVLDFRKPHVIGFDSWRFQEFCQGIKEVVVFAFQETLDHFSICLIMDVISAKAESLKIFARPK